MGEKNAGQSVRVVWNARNDREVCSPRGPNRVSEHFPKVVDSVARRLVSGTRNRRFYYSNAKRIREHFPWPHRREGALEENCKSRQHLGCACVRVSKFLDQRIPEMLFSCLFRRDNDRYDWVTPAELVRVDAGS